MNSCNTINSTSLFHDKLVIIHDFIHFIHLFRKRLLLQQPAPKSIAQTTDTAVNSTNVPTAILQNNTLNQTTPQVQIQQQSQPQKHQNVSSQEEVSIYQRISYKIIIR